MIDHDDIRLSEVLTIRDGEVRPRYSYAEYAASIFDGITPRLNFLDYERVCKLRGRHFSSREWADIRWHADDETASE